MEEWPSCSFTYGSGHTRDTCVAHLTFVVRDQVPNAVIPVNPLGLTVTYVRIDQAFR